MCLAPEEARTATGGQQISYRLKGVVPWLYEIFVGTDEPACLSELVHRLISAKEGRFRR
jgi:hypothetical protein